MPRMVKPLLPSRPVEARAAPKRDGLVGTEMPGSNRIRSLMSVARASSISSASMTVTVLGTLNTSDGVRVAVTVTESSA